MVAEIMSAVEHYFSEKFPAAVAAANARPLKAIVKAQSVNIQNIPCAALNLDSVKFEETGQNTIWAELQVDLYVFMADQKPDKLNDEAEKYIDAALAVVNDGTLSGTPYYIRITSADKGIEPDGLRGWVSVSFVVWGEAPKGV